MKDRPGKLPGVFSILQVVNTQSERDGGPARNSYELNLALNRQPGVIADLIAMHGAEGDSVVDAAAPRRREQFSTFGVTAPDGPRFGARPIQFLSLIRRVAQADAVLVHGYYLAWVPVVVAIAFLARTPLVITPHGALTAHQQNHSRIKKQVYESTFGWFIRKVSRGFVTGSAAESEQIRDRFPRSRSHVGGVGTPIPSMQASPADYTSPLRLLSISRIAEKKRIDLMIDAVAVLRDQGFAAQLVVCGSGDRALEADLIAQSAALDVEHLVSFVGHVTGPDKEARYIEADIFLLPSDDENFGIGLAEALAHGLPAIVSTNVAASAAMSTNSGRALSNPDGDSIAAAIRSFTSTTPRTLAGDSCITDARQHFAWDAVARDYLVAIHALA